MPVDEIERIVLIVRRESLVADCLAHAGNGGLGSEIRELQLGCSLAESDGFVVDYAVLADA